MRGKGVCTGDKGAGNPLINPRDSPTSFFLLSLNMTSTAEASGAPSRVQENKPDTEGDSDEEVFHDARFPAEEEAVS